MKINKLKPLEKNPFKSQGDAQIRKIADSIENFEKMMEIRKIVIDENNEILGGNKRYFALKMLNYTEIPDNWIDKQTELTDKQKKEFIIKDNAHWGSEWNFDLLDEWSKELGMDLTELGIGLEEIEEIFEGKIDDDEVPEVEEPICKKGDLWQLGDHRLLCGDATDKSDVERLMDGKKADMVFTDPPYGVNYKCNPNGKEWERMKGEELRGLAFYDLLFGAFQQLFDYTKENPAVYVWHADKTHRIFETTLNDTGFEVKQQLVWIKGMVFGRSDYHYSHEQCLYARKQGNNNEWFGDRKHRTMLRSEKIDWTKFKKAELINIINAIKDDSTVWEIKKDSVLTYKHPTQKPVDLALKAIMNNTIDGESVIDLFLGSGSTLIGCEKINRKCYGMELDPHYCDIIINRWQEFTGKKAEKI